LECLAATNLHWIYRMEWRGKLFSKMKGVKDTFYGKAIWKTHAWLLKIILVWGYKLMTLDVSPEKKVSVIMKEKKGFQ